MSEATDQEARCEVCGEAVSLSSALRCGRCAAPYHVDCWYFVGSCSIFGCGCTEAKRGQPASDAVALSASPQILVIDEHTRVPWMATFQPVALGLVRRMRVRVKDLPRTLAASCGGGLLALGGMLVFESYFGHLYGGGLRSQKTIAFQIAILYGLLAPFLSSMQLNHPRVTGILALGGFWAAFFLGPSGNFGFMLAIGFLILASSSVAESIFQLAPIVRESLGKGAMATRMVSSGLFMFLILCVCHPQVWYRGRALHQAQYLELGLWAILAVFTGASALETGKQEMKKCLPESQRH